ncbi:MAG: electron transfer flavoprotein subunit beta/FixA family protein [Anaerolineales bacterium]|jgi:electron transfer flavoprotein beta subunit
MKIAVPIMLVPDLVEELEIDPSGKALDMTWARLIINEFDEHAIEQAILLKEKYGGEVTVLAFNSPDVDDILFNAAAKGADRLIKLTAGFEDSFNNHTQARSFGELLEQLQPDLVLSGVQAHNDLDGQIGPLLAAYLEYPYLGYVAGVESEDNRVIAYKEFPGGLTAKMEVELPAVLGIQASAEPPRYVAFSRVRQAMKSSVIDEEELKTFDTGGGPEISKMYQPETAERALMIEGSVDEIAAKVLRILKEQGVA